MKLRTSLIISLQNIIARNVGSNLKAHDIKALTTDRVQPLLEYNDDLALSGKVSKNAIDALTQQIKVIEKNIEGRIHLTSPYDHLLSIPGVGAIIGATIMLETGPISRFPKVGNYVSYCRKVATGRFSNDKRKGSGNRKNGNRYLACVYSEASDHAKRYDEAARKFFYRKLKSTNAPTAHNALAHKLARAAYYIMRDGVDFMSEKAFA